MENYPHLTLHVQDYFKAVDQRFSSEPIADEEVRYKLARLFREGTSLAAPEDAAASLQIGIGWDKTTPQTIWEQKENLAHRIATQFVIAEEATFPEEVRVAILKECVQLLRNAHQRAMLRTDSPAPEFELPLPSKTVAREALRSFMETDLENLIAAADLFREESELPAKAHIAINALRAARLLSPYKTWRYRRRLGDMPSAS